MPSIYFPYINIALDVFALMITIIILASCFKEFSSKKARTRYFLLLLCSASVALIADTVSWFSESHINLYYMTVASNTLAYCAVQFAIICFMGYLKENLYESSRATTFILRLFKILCVCSALFMIGNAFFGYAFVVNDAGHWHHSGNMYPVSITLIFPMLAFFAIILMAVFAHKSTKINRAAFVVYTIFPVIGIILDYTIHGLSMTYVGLTVGILSMYTSIYIKKQRLIESQKNALMLSQINPHFVYNTLSTIASMCDISPKQAKNLTIDFSSYLRQNLSNLSYDEKIPFEKELNHVECYLKIEKARFREQLNVIYNIQCKDFNIPPLSVQPIVENAIKHGVTKKAEGGTVKISTFETNRSYVIEIIDDGVGFNTENVEMHVGIQNVRSRIMSLCKGDLNIKSTPGIGTRVTIEIPKKKGTQR